MAESIGAFNTAIDTAFQNDGTLTALVGKVFSGAAPINVPLDDYLVLGTDDVTVWGRFHGNGERVRTALHIWSRSKNRQDGARITGKIRVLELAGHVARILNDARLDLTDYGEALGVRADLESVFQDPDGEYWHGVMRVSAIARRD